ncbi:MAG: hypothetical protein ACU0GG_13815 [Paracoccaceae bacterium]
MRKVRLLMPPWPVFALFSDETVERGLVELFFAGSDGGHVIQKPFSAIAAFG